MTAQKKARGAAWLKLGVISVAAFLLFGFGLEVYARLHGADPKNAQVLRKAAMSVQVGASRTQVERVLEELSRAGIEHKWTDRNNASAWAELGFWDTCWLTLTLDGDLVVATSIRDDDGRPCKFER